MFKIFTHTNRVLPFPEHSGQSKLFPQGVLPLSCTVAGWVPQKANSSMKIGMKRKGRKQSWVERGVKLRCSLTGSPNASREEMRGGRTAEISFPAGRPGFYTHIACLCASPQPSQCLQGQGWEPLPLSVVLGSMSQHPSPSVSGVFL